MGLGRGIAEMMDAVRDRVEVSWHHDTWHVTAGSFESALAYIHERFDDPVVLSRRDHGRRWPRVTLDVSTDPARAAEAPPLEELAEPLQPPAPREPLIAETVVEPAELTGPADPAPDAEMPLDLEAIFASQNSRV
jgi:hypothetical protein